MKIFLRLLMLLGCGAVGVGLAFYLAILLDASPQGPTETAPLFDPSNWNETAAVHSEVEVRSSEVRRKDSARLEPMVQQPAPPRTRQVLPYPTTDGRADNLPAAVP